MLALKGGGCFTDELRLVIGSSGPTVRRRAVLRQHHDRPPGSHIRSVRIVSTVTVELLSMLINCFPFRSGDDGKFRQGSRPPLPRP